ncbi:uncharacterized protein J3D65DRAFT_553935 [Phyllosticta citribraziliensis]|uniref:Uncharacterized protein n=1 Tax=Phyllosticta citribraziliensis TaxID=989973 RepID=A0ABR1LR25_9PEZI
MAALLRDLICLATYSLMCILSWAGYDWRSTSIRHSSPDTVSPLYPDRPIRPLPKRRLRSRLSPEQAESITYPTPPVSSPPVFDFPYTHPDKIASISTRQQRGEKDHQCSCGADHSEQESEEDEDERLGWFQPRRKISAKGLLTTDAATGGTGTKPIPPGSTSSADGYESFENTNNKKKRKIPVSGSAGHHGNLTAEMASMGISNHGAGAAHEECENTVGQYYGSGSSAVPVPGSGTGISGAGRGRYGRSAARFTNERRPLGSSTSSLNAYANGNGGRARPNGIGAGGKGMFLFGKSHGANRVANLRQASTVDHGIISTAIANAQAAGKSVKGKENISLLQQEATKAAPQKTQFTFTCGSPNQPTWPGQNGSYSSGPDLRAPPPAPSSAPASRIPLPAQSTRGVTTHATQTSPQMNGTPQASTAGQQAPPTANSQQPAPQQQPKKPRRKPEKIYAMAARRRRLQQEYTNYHHPPSRDDIWICEFCEYEDIFGEPPRALIRQYEIKDRKEQKRMAEKRRLLEKAKMKGRKGKKMCKNSQSRAPASNSQHAQPHDQHYDDQQLHPDDGVEGQGDEYFEDDYDDGAPPHGGSDIDAGYIPPPAPSEPPDPKIQMQDRGINTGEAVGSCEFGPPPGDPDDRIATHGI